MKFKIHSREFFYSIIVLTLFASCNSGNKIVSSFGKRKYTKGYYFNFRSRKKPEMPVIVAKKVSGVSTPNIIQESRLPANDKVSAIASSMNQRKENKTSIWHISQYITSKTPYTLPKNNSQNISEYSQNITDYGVPGHGNVTDNASSSKYDGVATAGLILAILSILFLFADGFGIIFIVPAFICSVIGLKSKHRHGQAVAGLTISMIELVLIIALIIIFLELFSGGEFLNGNSI